MQLPAELCCPRRDEVHPRNETGPDIPGIHCWVPEGCCGASPCDVDEHEFLCALRSLLPEGDIYNNTRQATLEPPRTRGSVTKIGCAQIGECEEEGFGDCPPRQLPGLGGTVTIGCARVGCQQLIFGGCCEDQEFCNDDPIAPQLAVVDAYGAVAYGVFRAMCAMERESDPCTASADLTLERWGRRLGLVTDDLCTHQWSKETLAFLVCVMFRIKYLILNWENLQMIAGMFGADIRIRAAGDMNCEVGWITMARDRNHCPPDPTCPPGRERVTQPFMRIGPGDECQSLPPSLNIILCPTERRFPENCNMPPRPSTLPHDDEVYQAFLWLLPRILPPGFWCFYNCDADECVE